MCHKQYIERKSSSVLTVLDTDMNHASGAGRRGRTVPAVVINIAVYLPKFELIFCDVDLISLKCLTFLSSISARYACIHLLIDIHLIPAMLVVRGSFRIEVIYIRILNYINF